jgi:hypothetical protein
MGHHRKSKTQLNKKRGSKQANIIASEASIQESVSLVTPDPNGSSIPLDRSYFLNQDKFKNIIQTNAEGITFKSPSDIGFFAGGNIFESIAGDRQSVVGGDDHHYSHGEFTQQSGVQSPKEQKAAKDLQKLTSEIDKKKIDTIKNSKGDDYPCPICQQKILTQRAQQLTNKAFKIIRKYLPNFPYPLDIIQKYVNMLVVPFLSTTSNLSLNGGKGCGSPGCKNGTIKSVQKTLQDANQQAADDLKSKQDAINDAQKRMGRGGAVIKSDSGDIIWRVGLEKNDAPTCVETVYTATQFGLVNGVKAGDPLTADTKGSAKLVVHSDPLINPGSLFIDVSNKLTMAAGSPGVEIDTTGKVSINGATTMVTANQGELTLSSANRTFLKGKNVIIDAKDRSGDSGVKIDSDNTLVAGKLSVNGDISLKGSLMMDGGLHVPHITCPSERIASEPSGSAHQVHSNATWNGPNGMQATLFDKYDKIYKKAGRDAYNLLSLNILSPAEIKALTEESYSALQLAQSVDNYQIPTGYGWALGYKTLSPLKVLVAGPTGVMTGYVVPEMIPIHNYTHNHGSPVDNHSHGTSVPAFNGYDNQAAARAARPNPSHVPTSAPSAGMGTQAGHKTLGDNTSCGGGGGAFSNRKTPTQAQIDRNSRYGITGNPYEEGNYVPVTPEFNPDGSLKIPPKFDLCP